MRRSVRRLHGTLAAAAERGPADFPDLLLTPGVGARTVRLLAMVAEVVHGAPYRFRDPARFSLAPPVIPSAVSPYDRPTRRRFLPCLAFRSSTTLFDAV